MSFFPTPRPPWRREECLFPVRQARDHLESAKGETCVAMMYVKYVCSVYVYTVQIYIYIIQIQYAYEYIYIYCIINTYLISCKSYIHVDQDQHLRQTNSKKYQSPSNPQPPKKNKKVKRHFSVKILLSNGKERPSRENSPTE